MSVRLVKDTTIWECSMCPKIAVGISWRALANTGWTSDPAGDHEPIRLCADCAQIIANRRQAKFETA